MSEVSHAWLDRVVTARQRLTEAGAALSALQGLINRGDIDAHNYNESADDILSRDGASHRLQALRRRKAQLEISLEDAEKNGDTVGAILMGLTELLDAANETHLNTEALLSDIEVEDPFIDRLEEHPAHERY